MNVTRASEDGEFLPSRHGFPFPNTWPPQPAMVLPTPFGPLGVGNAAAGLCGGMVFAAADYWHARLPPPAARPARGDPLYRYLVRRILDSWLPPAGAARYYHWSNLPDLDRAVRLLGRPLLTVRGLARRTIIEEWPRIAAELDRGVPVPLGVVTVASVSPARLRHNHQVLAYGYRSSGPSVTVRVYDPNRGRRDDIRIGFPARVPASGPVFAHNLGLARPVRGFFRVSYTPLRPP